MRQAREGIARAARGALGYAERHPLLAGIGTNLTAEVARAATLPIIAIVAARYLGADQYGVLATGQVLVALAATLTGFGMLYAILQLGSQREEPLSGLLTTGLVAGLATAIVTYGGLALWVWLFPYDAETRRATMVIGLSLFATALTGQLAAGLQVQGRYTMIAVSGVIATALNLVFVVAVVLADGSVLALAWTSVIAASSNALIMAFALRRALRPRVRLSLARRLARIGLPFGVADFLFFIYFSIDIVILSILADERQVGLYNVPVRILVVLYLVPAVVFHRVLYPRFFDWATSDRDRLRQVYLLSSRVILILGLLAAALLVTFANVAIPFVFGDSFSDSVALLQVLALAVPLRYLASAPSTILATSGKNRERLVLVASAAVLNVGLCLVLIPFFEAMGASVATVVTEAFALASCLWVVHRGVLRADLAHEARPALVAVPVVLLVSAVALREYPWAAGALGALTIGSLALLAGPLHYVRRDEVFGSLRTPQEQGSVQD